MKVRITEKETKKLVDNVLWDYFSIDIKDVLKWAKHHEPGTVTRPFLQQYLNERYPENIRK